MDGNDAQAPVTLREILARMKGVIKNAVGEVIEESEDKLVDLVAKGIAEYKKKERGKPLTSKETSDPKRILQLWGEKTIFSIYNYLESPTVKDDVPPQQQHTKFSRFIFKIQDMRKAQTKNPKANIPVADIPGIIDLSELALAEKQRYKDEKSSHQIVDLSHEVILPMAFDGETVAEVLTEPKRIDDLIRFKESLERHVNRSSQFQIMVDAINDGLYRLENGTIQEDKSSRSSMVIYNEIDKYRTDETGKIVFYSIKIKCLYGHAKPWKVLIQNMVAPYDEGPNNLKIPRRDDRTDLFQCPFCFSDLEWSWIKYQITNILENYNRYYFGHLYNESKQVYEKNKIKKSDKRKTT